MARTVRDANLETRTARLRLPIRSEPYWRGLEKGFALGYRRRGKGGTWLHHRSEPPILHITPTGAVDRRFGQGMFVQAHGFCQDRDGNFWAGDSGPFADNPTTKGRGFQLFKFSPEGKVLLTYSQSEDPTSDAFGDQTRMFSEKQWRPILFRDEDIGDDPQLEEFEVHS